MRIRLALLSLALVACATTATPSPPAPPAPPPPPSYIPRSFDVKVSGQGRPVIFIPGLTCDGSVWDGTVAHFGGKIQAHVISLAGFAGKPPIDAPLIPTVRDEVIEYIKQNHLDHPIVVGHSLGGFLVFWIAETAPEVLGGAVAVDGGSFLTVLRDPAATPQRARPIAEKLSAGFTNLSDDAFRARLREFLGTMLSNPDDAKRMGAYDQSDKKTVGDALFLMMTTDLRPDLPKISVPLLEIAAGTVGNVPREELEKTWMGQIEAAPRHELVIIDNAKHFIMFDQPEAFYAALDKFIAGK